MTEYRAPSRPLLWSEPLRATTESAAFWGALPLLAHGPAGDGHPVLVLPGLMADDRSTLALRHVLGLRGFRPHAWRLGRNLGPTRPISAGLLPRLDEIHQRYGQPVSLVGWSLGGLYARELARRAPEKVRSVITLGSPFRLTIGDPPTATHAGPTFHALRPWHTRFLDRIEEEQDRPPLTMPATSIYSRVDGIVPWQACQELDGAQRENIEVLASHLGMGVHPQVLAIIIDRLRQPVGDWHPYAEHRAAA